MGILPCTWAYHPWFREIRFGPAQVGTRLIAKYSYGIYLSHGAVIMWSFALPVSTALKWVIFVPLAMIAPVAMYHLIEHPLILVGQRLGRRMFARSESPTEVSAKAATGARARPVI